MTEKNIYRALGELDPVLVEKAAPEGKIKNNTSEKRRSYFNKRILVAAACLLLAVSVLLGGNHLYGLLNGERPKPPVGSLGNSETYPPYYPTSGDGTIFGKPFEEPDLDIQSLSLMTGLSSNDVTARNADGVFMQTQMIFALKLFRAVAERSAGENVLISPLSIQLALAMTANGADGETREEMEKLLGGNIPLEYLNEYLKTYTTNLPSTDKSKFNIANSIWFRDGFEVEKGFLQTNADYYGAAAYKSAFNNQTVNDINNWVSENTDGMIEKLLDNISSDAVMFLINAITFDAEWSTRYSKKSVSEGTFYASNGTSQTVSMMYSFEHEYFVTDDAVGFFKRYAEGKYSFVGILPNEDISLDTYISNLDANELLSAVKNSKGGKISAGIPKFSYEYEITLSEILRDLGMSTAFDPKAADFSKINSVYEKGLYISEVKHKTFIDVTEYGTRAAAVTSVGMVATSTPTEPIMSITLDRPFLYMIVDNSTNLPIFIGTVNSID